MTVVDNEIHCPMCDSYGWHTFGGGHFAGVCGSFWGGGRDHQAPACKIIADLNLTILLLQCEVAA
jgi:hypothetical protein